MRRWGILQTGCGMVTYTYLKIIYVTYGGGEVGEGIWEAADIMYERTSQT